MGCETILFSVCGGNDNGTFDDAGTIVEGMCEDAGIKSYLYAMAERITTVKHRTVSGTGALLCRIDDEIREPVFLEQVLSGGEQGESFASMAGSHYEEQLVDCQAVVISDYAKGLLDPLTCQYLIEKATSARVPVFIDPCSDMWDEKYGGHLVYLLPNSDELAEFAMTSPSIETQRLLAAYPGTDEALSDNLHALHQRIIEEAQVTGIILTRGPDGLLFSALDGTYLKAKDEFVEVADTCGAGDIVTAQVASHVAKMLEEEGCTNDEGVCMGRVNRLVGDSLRNAALAATMSVKRIGVNIVTLEDIMYENAKRHWRRSDCTDKIFPAEGRTDNWLEEIQRARLDNRTIVFTNGVYDLLHAGHVSSIQWASWQADNSYVVVGMNSDASVKKYKGEDRPYVPQQSRAFCLAALACVDQVLVFEEVSVADILGLVKPDVYVKGGEYKEKFRDPEYCESKLAQIVVENGGRMEFAPMLEHLSTTNIAEEIKESNEEEKAST
jgi:D-beta-D-heptose 7-phosphate kinase/D-beta-D-heptose 1-phosphate adenosyltransferase